MTPLRDYQVRALEQVRDQLRSGKRAVCCVLPTGAGKTRIGAEMALGANDRARRTLWLAHRNELVQQAAERIRAEGIGRVGVIKADVFPDPGALVQVASVQTLLAQGKRPEAELVVFDEAHHYVSSDWGALAQHYSGAWRIGLTATP
ncbi:MAG TPA: DEAD/DEAH box helicase family protein, partial [Polyangiaceae bacterium]